MKTTLLILLGLFAQSIAFSQSLNDQSLTDLQVKNAVGLYNHFTDGNAPIYSGTEYLYYNFKMDGDPFFLTGRYTIGSVGYEGRMYDSVSIFYDVQRNQLVLLGPDSLSNIVLNNPLVDSFNLLGHLFISLQEDHKKNLYNAGFYDFLYRGHIQLISKRVKTMRDVINNLTITRVFSSEDRYYIYKDGLYYLVSNKKDVLRLFSDKEHDIKRMLHREHLKLKRKTFEVTLVKVTAFYDQLIH